MRVVVLSATAFGRSCIQEALVEDEFSQVAGIITTPSQVPISYRDEGLSIARHVEFQSLGEQLDCPVVTLAEVVRADLQRVVNAMRPDLILVLGWYHMLSRSVRELAPLGTLGIHASLLPRYRGGAPVSWAIINGETETGVTLFHLEDGVDDGDIVDQVSVPILRSDDVSDVYQRATGASIEMLRRTLPALADGTASRRPQDHSKATQFPQRSAQDGLISWDWTADQVYDFVRAITKPYPGAFTNMTHGKLTIWRIGTDQMDGADAPGTVRIRDSRVFVSCANGWVELLEAQLADGPTASGAELARSLRWAEGSIFE